MVGATKFWDRHQSRIGTRIDTRSQNSHAHAYNGMSCTTRTRTTACTKGHDSSLSLIPGNTHKAIGRAYMLDRSPYVYTCL